MNMTRQIILDTETTGLEVDQGHRLIEIGCLEMMNRRLTNRSFHYYLNPEREVDPGAFQIHGLSNEFLADKPLFANIAHEFMEFIQNAELIIHNATFDVAFLNAELCRMNYPEPDIRKICKITDTLLLARQKHPGQPNNLDALCRRYQVNNVHRHLHGALLDSELLAHVYLRMTGGQELLFTLNEETPQNLHAHPSENMDIVESPTVIHKNRKPLPVILPTAAEQEAHQVFLNRIKQQSEHCLWLDGD